MPRPRKFFHYGYNYFRLPTFIQVMFKRIQLQVDRYAKIDKQGVITYTRKDTPDTIRTLSVAETQRIFTDLYGEVVDASEAN